MSYLVNGYTGTVTDRRVPQPAGVAPYLFGLGTVDVAPRGTLQDLQTNQVTKCPLCGEAYVGRMKHVCPAMGPQATSQATPSAVPAQKCPVCGEFYFFGQHVCRPMMTNRIPIEAQTSWFKPAALVVGGLLLWRLFK